LPLNSKNKVLKVLPSLFEDFVDIKNLSFFVKKLENNKFLCFGYEESKIIEAIKISNLSIHQVKNIYFGQIELEKLVKTSQQTCMKVDNICLSYIDNILVQIPIVVKTNIQNDLNIDDIELSKNIIHINSSSKYIDTKYSYILSTFFILFSISIFAKIISNNLVVSKIPNEIEYIKNSYNMPNTMMQTNSIIKRLNKTVKNQKKIREAFYYILSFKKKNSIQILNLKIKNNSIECKITDTTTDKIKSYINDKYKVTFSKVKNNIIIIGFNI
jgi:hypothetical protein